MKLSHKRVGGIRFLRIGRLQLSFCVCRRAPKGRYPQGDDMARGTANAALTQISARRPSTIMSGYR
jgi:hypothetical protein